VKIFLQIFTLGSRPGTPRRGYSETAGVVTPISKM